MSRTERSERRGEGVEREGEKKKRKKKREATERETPDYLDGPAAHQLSPPRYLHHDDGEESLQQYEVQKSESCGEKRFVVQQRG